MVKADEVPFADLLSNIVDNRGRTCPTVAEGLPLIATNCVKPDRLYPAFEKVRFVSKETRDHWFRGHPEPGDIIFVCKGSPGRVALTPDPVSFCIAQDMVAIRADPDRIYPLYLFALLRSRSVQLRIRNMHVGTLIPHFKKGDFGRLLLPVVSPHLQRVIGDSYFDFSAKIESNRRISDLIPSVIAAQVTEALSRGSEALPVAQLARFVNGGAFTKGVTGEGRMVIRIAELKSGPGPSTVYNELDVPDEKLARAGDLLMSWSGSLGVYRWAREEAIVNQHVFKVIARSLPAWLVYDRLAHVMPSFQRIAQDKATTMGHIQRGHLDSTVVQLPGSDEIERLDRELLPLWERLLVAERESLRLETLRDVMLTGLLTGRMRVSEPQEAAESPA